MAGVMFQCAVHAVFSSQQHLARWSGVCKHPPAQLRDAEMNKGLLSEFELAGQPQAERSFEIMIMIAPFLGNSCQPKSLFYAIYTCYLAK